MNALDEQSYRSLNFRNVTKNVGHCKKIFTDLCHRRHSWIMFAGNTRSTKSHFAGSNFQWAPKWAPYYVGKLSTNIPMNLSRIYIRLLSGLLNMIIPGSEFAIRGDCERIEQRLKSKCYSALREFYSLMGRKKNGNLPLKNRSKWMSLPTKCFLWTICSMISVNLNLGTRTGRKNKKRKN